MNIVEALKIAKEQGKKVRPKGRDNWAIEYKNGSFLQNYETSDNIYLFCYALTEDILGDWEIVREKPSKETQHKIDSMKFQIVRHCKNIEWCNGSCGISKKCFNKAIANNRNTPKDNFLDDWSLKDIVEAYHILKEAGEI